MFRHIMLLALLSRGSVVPQVFGIIIRHCRRTTLSLPPSLAGLLSELFQRLLVLLHLLFAESTSRGITNTQTVDLGGTSDTLALGNLAPEPTTLAILDESPSGTGAACSCSATHAVDVASSTGRKVVVDDVVELRQIDTAGNQVGSDEEAQAASRKSAEGPATVRSLLR